MGTPQHQGQGIQTERDWRAEAEHGEPVNPQHEEQWRTRRRGEKTHTFRELSTQSRRKSNHFKRMR